MNIPLLVVAVVMVVGVVGTLLPLVPGIPLILVAMAGYGFATGFAHYSWVFVLAVVVLGAVGIVVDYVGGLWGIRRFGGSSAGIWGAGLGMVAGMIVLGLPGLVLGLVMGGIIGEAVAGRPLEQAIKVGLGSLIAFLGAGLLKFFVALVMVSLFWLTVV